MQFHTNVMGTHFHQLEAAAGPFLADYSFHWNYATCQVHVSSLFPFSKPLKVTPIKKEVVVPIQSNQFCGLQQFSEL